MAHGENLASLDRRELLKLLALVSPGVHGSRLSAEGSQTRSPSAGSQQPETAPPMRSHPERPRLFYDIGTLRRLKQRFVSHPQEQDALRSRGEELVKADLYPESVAEVGGGQQANYITPANQIAEMGLTLGLLFHLTGEHRYADKLREALLYYTGYVRWAGPGLVDRVPPWHSELDTSRFSFGYAAGYDALRHMLSETDRGKIADGIVRLGALTILDDWILPGKRIHSLDSMGHNWWGVCVAGGGLCALALLGDDPRARAWIDAVDAGFAQWFGYPGNVLQNRMPTFERSGPSYESVGYTNYGVSEYLRYRLAWKNTFPTRHAVHMEPLDGIAMYFLQTLYSTSAGFYSINFNDSSLQVDVTETIYLLIACGLGTPEASRYLEQVHTNPQGTLLTLLRGHATPEEAKGDVPASWIYPEMGWAMMRSSWSNDATLLAMKSGYTWNHAHADAGTFLLFHHGQPLIIDSGTCAYSRREYTGYYCQSRAHNVILFNGEGQPDNDFSYGCKFPGRMHSLIDGLGLKYVYADATGPMARWFRRNYRHWLWSGDVILVVDTVLAYEAGKMDWLLHYQGEYQPNSAASATLRNGSAQAVVTMLYPPATLHEDFGLADHDPDKKIPYLVFSAAAASESQHFLTAICLKPERAPKMDLLTGENYIGVRVQSEKTVEELYLNLRSVNGSTSTGVVMGQWETDAYLTHLTKGTAPDAPVDRYFVSDGSYLRRDNRSHLESLSKLAVCWRPTDPLSIFSDDRSKSIRIGAESSVRTIRWNGHTVSGSYNSANRLTSLERA